MFQPTDITDYIMPGPAGPPTGHLPSVTCSGPSVPLSLPYEAFLPDSATLMGRFLLAGWDHGIEGADDAAAQCLSIALQVGSLLHFFIFFYHQ